MRARLVLPGEDYDTDVSNVAVLSGGVLLVDDADGRNLFAPGEWLRVTYRPED